MPLDLLGLLLIASFLNASWNALVKLQGDKLVTMAQVTLAGSVLSAPFLLVFDAPPSSSWGWLALSIVLHTAYHLFLPVAYQYGDLGKVYPIARGSAPLLVTVAAWLLVGESLSPLATFGVIALAVGVMVLSFEGGHAGRMAVRYALLTGVFIASYTFVDAMGARGSGLPWGFAVWLTLGDGLLTYVIVLGLRGRIALKLGRRSALIAYTGGGMQVAAYWIAIWALTQAPMGQVSAIRETSVLFAALISAFVLKEGFGLLRLVSTALIFLGLAATKGSK
jgi:drug/metabolite transporter (DMT)-like permease